MDKYSYQIAGRSHNKIKQEMYDGTVMAENSGEALKLALKDTFGDPDLSDPVMSLADWYGDSDDLEREFSEIEEESEVYTLYLTDDETSFVVEVTKL